MLRRGICPRNCLLIAVAIMSLGISVKRAHSCPAEPLRARRTSNCPLPPRFSPSTSCGLYAAILVRLRVAPAGRGAGVILFSALAPVPWGLAPVAASGTKVSISSGPGAVSFSRGGRMIWVAGGRSLGSRTGGGALLPAPFNACSPKVSEWVTQRVSPELFPFKGS